MSTSKYFLQGENSNIPQSIKLRFLYGNKRLVYSTGYKILPKHWDEKKEVVRNKTVVTNRAEINKGLSNLKIDIESIYTQLQNEGKHIDNHLLRLRLSQGKETTPQKNNSPYVHIFLSNFIKDAPYKLIQRANGTTEPLKENTIKGYTTTLNHIEKFDKKQGTPTRFSDLNLQFHTKFIKYLGTDNHLAMLTIATRIKDLKSIAKHARREGVEVCNDIFTNEFFKPTDKSINVYLDDQEIKQIFDFDFNANERLDNVRDLFIIGLRTGLRVSDFIRLKETNIKEGFIVIDEVKKTGDSIIIPLHPQIELILAKRDGNLPRLISHTKFNDYIKEVCEKVGLNQLVQGTKHSEMKIVKDPKTGGKKKIYRKETGHYPKHELISSHTCRRSFSSNLYGKLPNMVIMAITGHKSEKTFLNYIKITPKEHAETLRALWMKQINENNQTVKMARV
jgi:hypothetical protein